MIMNTRNSSEAFEEISNGVKNKIFKLTLSLSIFMMAGFFVAKDAKAAEITVDTVWTKAQSPIVVSGTVWLKAGVNLTIEKGVAVKFDSSSMLLISGKLIALGAKAEPIVFTSIKDDSSGGDTNGDGAASQPAPGDWSYLFVNQGGEANLDYATVQYGGGADEGAVINYKGKLTINNSVITKNKAGVSNNRGVLTISNSSITNNPITFIGSVLADAAIGNNGQAEVIVNASNNWWGTADGPCPWRELLPSGVPIWEVDIKAICGDKPLVDSGVVYSPWLIKSPDEPAEPDPVILVPGIMGRWEVRGQWRLDPIFHSYDNL
ncbi:MAG: hypothetical protein PHR36_05360, partial [Patescibacteria group bacterium]|nr:hypothetical protein [Patescibacteria group bacterium]